MKTKFAILRGINVGGKRKVIMTDLKSLCMDLGLAKVSTYIQSGNIIFKSDDKNSDLEDKLEKAITHTYGFDIPVVVRTSEELQNAVETNPFYDSNADINKLHLTFLKNSPTNEDVLKTAKYNYLPDKLVIKNNHVFIFCEGKYHQSKLTNNFFEKKLKVPATTRNWKTVLKLLELSKS